jgi:GntR family transcriptional regulator/MocR family aminotransferase
MIVPSLIRLSPSSAVPMYLQIANSLIVHIQSGVLKKGIRLPGTRQLADALHVHRKTVQSAYDELQAQGWIDVLPQRGSFIAEVLPEVVPAPFGRNEPGSVAPVVPDLPFNSTIVIPQTIRERIAFNDGLPDVRLAPREELARLYSTYIRFGEPAVLQYGSVFGQARFREVFSRYLNETRGLKTGPENLLTTRGSQMGLYLAGLALLHPGDCVIVGELNYRAANMTLETLGARLQTVPVDDDGLDIDAVEALCRQMSVKALYVTSHHYHPTTVTLKPERRVRLIALANRYRFFVIEDDYDYDFHYANRPVLPLASADRNVIYLGSFTKRLAPAFRVGYVAGPEELIAEMAKHRRIIDRQGDSILELCLADMLENGALKRHASKALKIYRQRRDLACELLTHYLGDAIRFQVPEGGLAIWARFDPSVDLPLLSQKAAAKGVYLSNGAAYPGLNACRMGFAALNEKELTEGVQLLARCLA